jgi:hypothetical protein
MPTILAAEAIPVEDLLTDGFPTSSTPFWIPESFIDYTRA